MILADVNVLVYAFDEEADNHAKYRSWLLDVLSGPVLFALVDTVLSGFVRVVTDHRIYEHPSTAADALSFVGALVESPLAVWLSSSKPTWKALGQLTHDDRAIKGKLIPDAYLAAVAIANGARIATADRGFARYRGLNWFDPAR